MLDLQPESQYDTRHLAAPKGNAWHVYRRLLGYAWAYKFRLIVSIFFAVAVAVSLSSMVLSVAGMVDLLFTEDEEKLAPKLDWVVGKVESYTDGRLTAACLERVTGWTPDDIGPNVRALMLDLRANRGRALTWLSIALVVLAVLGGLARFLQEYLAGTIGASISVNLAGEMFENIMRSSVAFFERMTTGEILARFTNDVFMVNRGLAGVFVKLMREPIKAAFFLAIALSTDWRLTLVVLVVLPLIAYVMIRIGRRVKRSVGRALEKIGAMASVAAETVNGIAIVKAYCMEEYETKRVRAELAKLRHNLVRMIEADAAIGPIIELLMVLGIVILVILANRAVESGQMAAGDLIKLFGAIALTLDPVRKLSSVNNLIQTSVASAERVFEFIDIEPDVIQAPDAVDLPPLERTIRFEDVRFSYDGETEVLKGISFDVNKGEMVALVGFSGGGKSTIVKMIPRFYDPTSGRITIDGTDIRSATFASLRGQISIVTQDTILFNESIRDNIAFGRASYSGERVCQAARAAQAAGFIERLSRQYDTNIGESGATLSGGQRQRLAIARAIVKDPAILILDEATSSLDTESERAIQQAVDEFVVGRTTLVIAHRLSTIQRAGRILVIDDGRIVEEGSHQQLMAKGGLYRRLYDTQFASAETVS